MLKLGFFLIERFPQLETLFFGEKVFYTSKVKIAFPNLQAHS